MRNKYYSRILCKQQLKQVLPGLTNFKPQEQHITIYFQHIFNLTRQQNMCQNIFCYTSTCISSIVLTYCCVIKMYILCHSAAQKPSQILPNIEFFFFLQFMYNDIRCCTPVTEYPCCYYHTVNLRTCSVMSIHSGSEPGSCCDWVQTLDWINKPNSSQEFFFF